LSRLSGDDIAALQKKAFLIAPPESARAYRSYGEASEIVSFRDGVAYSKFDTSNGVAGCDSHAEAVVRRFRKAVTEAAEEAINVLLRPGDVLMFDNYRMLHRRERFTPYSSAEGRWLRRLYGLTAKQSSDLLQ
jgi:alpha-ketoglutarate-dependent taurine dioxygenase